MQCRAELRGGQRWRGLFVMFVSMFFINPNLST